MAQKKRRRISGDLSESILLVIFKEGALTLTQLQEHIALQRLDFHDHHKGRSGKPREKLNVAETCDDLVSKNLLQFTDDAKYGLTEKGKVKAEQTAAAMERGAAIIENQFLSPTATARNTTASYVFMSVLKLLAGFFSGSVGLIADGADTTVDTAASGIVWFGIKFKKEVLGTITIIGLMFLTAVILCYDAVTSVIENIQGVFVPMSMPYVVIFIELLAMASMYVISLYQRYVGKRSQSLALISQSIDSKNSVYCSTAVIVGALFSILGVHWVDAVVGGFIAVRISIDGLSLSKEVAKSMRGQQPEFSKYKLPFEKQIEKRRMDNFRNWVMYAIHDDGVSTRQEIVASLEKAFKPSYMPDIYSEFIAGRSIDFQSSFADIINPLIGEAYLLEAKGAFSLTDKGKAYIKGTVSSMRYKQTEL
jgi:cation diffusion facilitator family transporter